MGRSVPKGNCGAGPALQIQPNAHSSKRLPLVPHPPLNVVILGNGTKAEVKVEAARLSKALEGHTGIAPCGVDLAHDTDLSSLSADVALVLGGDGTVLHTARRM